LAAQIRELVDVPAVDHVVAAVKQAELLADLRAANTSRVRQRAAKASDGVAAGACQPPWRDGSRGSRPELRSPRPH
jgi:hypothetical protein